MTFEAPQALLLAIPLGLLVWKLGRIAAPAAYLRWALVPVLTLALARPVLDRGGDQIDLVLVVDRSRSMPQGSDAAAEEILGYAESRRAAGQRVGIVTFGREARVERAPSSEARLKMPRSSSRWRVRVEVSRRSCPARRRARAPTWTRNLGSRALYGLRTGLGVNSLNLMEHVGEPALVMAEDRFVAGSASPAAKEVVEVAEARLMNAGHRARTPNTEEDIAKAVEYANRLGYVEGRGVSISVDTRPNAQTSIGLCYEGALQDLKIAEDLKPAISSGTRLTANERISERGAIAHEVVGHREAYLAGRDIPPRPLEEVQKLAPDVRQLLEAKEEAQASLRAAKFAPELTASERKVLYEDAMDRLATVGMTAEDLGKMAPGGAGDLYLNNR